MLVQPTRDLTRYFWTKSELRISARDSSSRFCSTRHARFGAGRKSRQALHRYVDRLFEAGILCAFGGVTDEIKQEPNDQ
jgi:hypothetical protein